MSLREHVVDRARAGLWMTCVVLWMTSAAALAGCSSYAVPGGPADISMWADARVADALMTQPAANFPVNLAVVRVQESGYRHYGYSAYGHGAFSVATGTDIESPENLQRLARLPGITAAVWMNTLLLPAELRGESDLRRAAARLHAPILAIYTLDTDFYQQETLAPLTVVTLGLAPNQTMHVQTVASALILDTQTGYVYGTAEGRASRKQLASHWTSEEAVDQSRAKTEAEAFAQLMDEFEKVWKAVEAEYGQEATNASANR